MLGRQLSLHIYQEHLTLPSLASLFKRVRRASPQQAITLPRAGLSDVITTHIQAKKQFKSFRSFSTKVSTAELRLHHWLAQAHLTWQMQSSEHLRR
jgi:hypothetical protein